jgi:hypothetical protein
MSQQLRLVPAMQKETRYFKNDVITAISSFDYFFRHLVAVFQKTESHSQESLKLLALVPIHRQDG